MIFKNIDKYIVVAMLSFVVFSNQSVANTLDIKPDKAFHDIVLTKYFSNYLDYQKYRMYKNSILFNTSFNYNYHNVSGSNLSSVSPAMQFGASIKSGIRINVFSTFYLEPTISLNPSGASLVKGTYLANNQELSNISLFQINSFYSMYLVAGKRFGTYKQPTHAVEFIIGRDTSIYSLSSEFSQSLEDINTKSQSVSTLMLGSRFLFGEKLKYGAELTFSSSQLNPFIDRQDLSWNIKSFVISFIYKFF